MEKMTEKFTEKATEVTKAMETVQKDMQKSVDEYIALGIKAQDEIFKMATTQMSNLREYTEFALRSQTELMTQLEKTAKHNRQVWLDGLAKLRENMDEAQKTVSSQVNKK
ncbi:MAG: hypothetical protein H3C47_15065 [Candidatus Cloacimonetes bacterium]|nr:hypothetical protein [Candidatus Cloacimonadota bacterium]